MTNDKVRIAVDACLEAGSTGYGEYPFIRMRAFIYTLRSDPGWTDSEIMEVQMNVIRVLTSRLAGLERATHSDLRLREFVNTGVINLLI